MNGLRNASHVSRALSLLARAIPLAVGCLLSAPSARAQGTAPPATQPATQPATKPATQPATKPATQPTAQPTTQPATKPTTQPTTQPATQPTTQPTAQPATQPTTQPETPPATQPETPPATQPETQPPATSGTPPSAAGPDLPTDPPLDQSHIKPSRAARANAIAKEAELTPIVPSPANPLKPAFQLYAEVDLPVLGVGIVFAASRLVRSDPARCAPVCDPSDLNALDRTVAGRYNPTYGALSDAGLLGLALGAPLLLALDEGPLPALNDVVVIAQSALIATVVPSLATLGVARPRPYLYGEEAPLALREGSDGSLSFISSHTSMSFAIATSTFMAMRRLHPKSAIPWVVLGVGLTTATGVAISRVMAGSHFPSDVIAGAVTGSSVGVLIPSLHGSPVRVVPQLGGSYRGAALSHDF